MDYEVSHVYLDGKIGTEQLIGINIVREMMEDGDEVTLMIDDYSGKHGGVNRLTINEVMDFYEINGMALDQMARESDFTDIAEKILNSDKVAGMMTREGFRKQKKDVFFMNAPEKKIKCKDVYRDSGEVKYACPLLSAAWHLCRSGYWKGDEFTQTRDIHSVLPKEYEAIEEMASYIAGLFGCKISYTFY